MSSILRRAGVLLVAGLIIMPVASAQAMRQPSKAVLLRYHFVPGQTFTYTVTAGVHKVVEDSTGGPAASFLSGLLTSIGSQTIGAKPLTVTATVRYHVLTVDMSGGADMEITVPKVTFSVTKLDSVKTRSLYAPPPRSVHINADGSLQDVADADLATYPLEVMGTLPSGAVSPGAHWSSPLTINPPADLGTLLNPISLSSQYVFAKYVQVNNQRTASISGTSTVQPYEFDSSTTNIPLHVQVTASMTSQSLFGLSAHRIISSQSRIDVHLYLGRHRPSANAGAGQHYQIDLSVK